VPTIFLPDQFDFASQVVVVVVATAIGGMIVEAFRGSMSFEKTLFSISSILAVGALIWLACYNLPAYGLVFWGDRQKGCNEGMPLWQKANEVQPKLGLAYLRIGSCFFAARDYDSAITWLGAGKIYEPKGQILTKLGYSYLWKDNYVQAAQEFRVALQFDPNNFDGTIGLGIALLSQKDYSAALPTCTKAVNLNSKSSIAHFWLAWALYENNRCDEAIEHFKNGASTDEPYVVGRRHAGLGFCYMKASNYGLARQEFGLALASYHDQEDVQQALLSIQGK
jgi:tetratricopeptide (TPR) repeat protein